MKAKSFLLPVMLFGGCASTPLSAPPISTALQVEITDAQRAHCEIYPFASNAEVGSIAHSGDPVKITSYIADLEVDHNNVLANCSLRGDSLVRAIDTTNAQLEKLAHGK